MTKKPLQSAMNDKMWKRKLMLQNVSLNQFIFLSNLCGTKEIHKMDFHDLTKAIKKTRLTETSNPDYRKIMAARIVLHGQRALTMNS